ncbi:hypothetical protein [Mangrovimonas spongiae]|uniref:STAS/SEC14 domain-containing protein n=1 Tax=Mangrovimonas spongiae TaxID=2494697 RepID=A0A3R9PI21_9FLAO|nr:hypothetical protein [Mangrovimonas spongiae]RSK38679.1 hypothetical protein EJA19_11520 [Mangrovimonas spongiae]
MKVLKSPLAKHVEATYCLEIGDFHFFENYLIAEFKQGVCVSFSDLKEVYDLLLDYYNGESYGFISNRINSYSIDVIDMNKHFEKLNQIHTYAIVTYNLSAKRVLAVEDYYFNLKRERFTSLLAASNWVTNEMAIYKTQIKLK